VNSVNDEFAAQYAPIARPAVFGTREYFAAHAPAMPEWFKQQSEEPAPVVPSTCVLTVDQRHEYYKVKAEEHQGEISAAVLAFINTEWTAKKVAAEWAMVQRAKSFFAWRRYYADMMIQTLAGGAHDV